MLMLRVSPRKNVSSSSSRLRGWGQKRVVFGLYICSSSPPSFPHHGLYRRFATATSATEDKTPVPHTKALVETKTFYETQAHLYRHYFYVIDTHGRVYLEDCKHRNFVTALRDQVFLRMLFALQRVNKTGLFERESPFLSPCGKEINFMRYEDSRCALVFGRLQRDGESDLQVEREGDQQLADQNKRLTLRPDDTFADYSLYIGQSFLLKQAFNPSLLSMDEETGRFYHRITQHKYLSRSESLSSKPEQAEENMPWGLLHPLITQQLSELLSFDEDKECFVLQWKGKSHIVSVLS
jgi:hypothetical protein